MIHRTLYLLLLIALLFAVAAPAAPAQGAAGRAPQATLTVNTAVDENDGSCSDGDCSLRDAIAVAVNGDTIVFAGDTSIYLGSTLSIGKRLTVDGSGHAVKVSGDTGNDGTRNVQVFGIYSGSVVTLSHMSIVSGTASSGGGIYNSEGTLTVQDSTLSGNSASYGGGIYNKGTLTVQDSTLSGNSATYGGGIFSTTSDGSCTASPATRIVNSTLSGNSATIVGGGIHNDWGVTEIVYSTITANTAPAGAGGGVRSYNDGVTCTRVGSSLIAGNVGRDVAADDTAQRFYSLDYNVVGTAGNNVNFTLEFNQAHDQTGVAAPGLAALAANGGPTWTHALLSGSPAIDAGNPASCPATDQRGQPRNDWACDSGAFEVQLGDSDTVSKNVTPGYTYTFGPTLVRVQVSGDGGCLTGLTAQRVESDHPSATDGIKTGRYWSITPIPAGCTSGLTLALTLPLSGALTGSDKACRYSGSGWDCGQDADNSGATNGPGAMPNVVTRQNVTQLSEWASGSGVGPNAVRLAHFSGRTASPAAWWLLGLGVLAGLALLGFGGRRLGLYRRGSGESKG